MKLKSNSNRFIVFTVALSLSGGAGLFAQAPAQNAGSQTESQAGNGSDSSDVDLERSLRLRQDGPRYVHTYLRRTRESISRLYGIVSSFGSEVEGSEGEFQKIRETYRKGLQKYYMGDLPGSLSLLEQTERSSDNLTEKFSDLYYSKTETLLQEAADALVEKDLSLMHEGATEYGGTRDLQKSQFKTRIAFQQFSRAEELRKRGMHGEAIEHMRVAKIHAINVLLAMSPDEKTRKSLSEKYRTDLEDAYGKFSELSETESSSASSEKK